MPAGRAGQPPGTPGEGPGQAHSPAVCEEAAADVPGSVAPGRGAGHALRLDRLPGELGAVEVAVLLPLGRQGAPGRAAVGRVLAGDVALAVTPGDRAPGSRQKTHFTVLPAQTWWPRRQRDVTSHGEKVTLYASKGERRKEVQGRAPASGRGAGTVAVTSTGHAGRRACRSGGGRHARGEENSPVEKTPPLDGVIAFMVEMQSMGSCKVIFKKDVS